MPFLLDMAVFGRRQAKQDSDSFWFAFDILPRSANTLFAFVLVNHKVTVWGYRLSSAKDERGFFWAGDWRLETVFALPFAEPFHVAAADGSYFFVTDESGEVYGAEQVDGQWKPRTVWKDAARPVRAMLVEGDGATAFVFGKDFYLKLAKGAEPKPCRDVTQGPKDFLDPLRTVYECGRVLYEKGELKRDEAKK